VTDPALRNIAVLGTQTKRDKEDIEVTTRFGRTIPKGKVRELFPYGFAARAKSGTVLVLFEGGDVRSPVILPVSDQEGVPELEEGDSAIWTATGGRVIARNDGSVEILATDGSEDVKPMGSVTLTPEGKAIVHGKDGKASVELDADGGVTVIADGSTVALAPGGKATITAKEITLTGGDLVVAGAASPSGSGPFCAIPNCLFSGAPHVGNKVSGT